MKIKKEGINTGFALVLIGGLLGFIFNLIPMLDEYIDYGLDDFLKIYFFFVLFSSIALIVLSIFIKIKKESKCGKWGILFGVFLLLSLNLIGGIIGGSLAIIGSVMIAYNDWFYPKLYINDIKNTNRNKQPNIY